MIKFDPKNQIAYTGRIVDWANNPENRLPASCTVFVPKDSMEGADGIEDSWLFVSHGLRNAAGVAIDLSNLRASGTRNGKGLTASGPCSFAKIYSTMNEILRRGGIFKNGAITLFLNLEHSDIEQYLNLTSKDIPWAKRAVYITKETWEAAAQSTKDLLAKRVNEGTVWLAKKQWDEAGDRLYSNVCQEILIKSRGTCMLSSVNLGVTAMDSISNAFVAAMDALCKLHSQTGIGDKKHYLKPQDDKQVGLGVIGLANLLAIYDVKYVEFVNALEHLLGISAHELENETAIKLAYNIIRGYEKAAEVAKSYGMERAFAIAPTASMSYRYQDAEGYTTAPEISPPLALSVDRDSATFGVQTYNYHPNSEISSSIGWDTQFRLLCAWQVMMDSTGLSHAISANIWSEQYIDSNWIGDTFLSCPLKTTYYRLQVDQTALDKSEIKADTISEEADNEDIDLAFFSEDELKDLHEEPIKDFCPLQPGDDPNFCDACSG